MMSVISGHGLRKSRVLPADITKITMCGVAFPASYKMYFTELAGFSFAAMPLSKWATFEYH